VAANTSYHFRDDGTLMIEDGVDIVGIRDDPSVTTSPTFANIPAFIDASIASASSTNSGLTDTQLRATPVPVTMGTGELTTDAWGIQKISIPHSIDHGMFTFDISPQLWFMYHNNTQVYTSTNIVSSGGAGVLTTDVTNTTLRLESRLCPRYQPNRGHLFSTALWCPSKTADGVRNWGLGTTENRVHFRMKADGKLYAVLKSAGAETYEEEIDTSGVTNFDVQKGNVYDIQYQWRGVGNYFFYINLTLVHTINQLGTLTALSLANPALPQLFECIRTTANVSMSIGCADTTSENGDRTMEHYTSAYSQAVATNGANKPVLVMRNPLQINGATNTRTIMITWVRVINDKKCTFKVWRTRTPAAITGATYKAVGNGSYTETDSTNMDATAVRATAVTVASLEFVAAITVEANVSSEIMLSDHNHIEFAMVRGDYLVITNDSTTGTSNCIVEWGEEI